MIGTSTRSECVSPEECFHRNNWIGIFVRDDINTHSQASTTQTSCADSASDTEKVTVNTLLGDLADDDACYEMTSARK